MQDPKRILYVDDEPANLLVFQAAFEDDYELSVAESGREALEVLRRHPVDLVVTDMRMPGMDGVELLRRVIREFPDVLRIVMTGYTDVESVVKAVNEGKVYQYVTKPWDIDSLRVVLNRALHHAGERRREKRLIARLDDEARQQESIRTVFQRYVPEPVVHRILEDQAWIDQRAPERAEVTALLCDLRGFTPMCADHTPEAVLALLNEYFDVMTGVVEGRGGCVNQFLGDAVLAFFGAPVAVPDHEQAAAEAALDMLDALREFNATRAEALIGAHLQVGIGLQRGVAAVGNVGSPNKMVYTAVGDLVYQVAEVEAGCKGTPDRVLITEGVRRGLADRFQLRPASTVQFEGADEATALYQLLDREVAR